MIQQLAFVGSSSSLHSEACNALGVSDGVVDNSISQEVIAFVRSPTVIVGLTGATWPEVLRWMGCEGGSYQHGVSISVSRLGVDR